MGQTRAGFLGAGAAAIGGAALAGAWRSETASAASVEAAAQPTNEPLEGAFDPRFGGDFFYVQFAGEGPGGFVDDVQGGVARSDIVIEKIGADHIQRKHIAGVKYEDISVSAPMGASKGFYDWIKASLDRKPLSKRGSIAALDKRMFVTGAADFTDSMLTEFGLPQLDAGSKDAAKMTIKFSPSSTRFKSVQGRFPVNAARAPSFTWKTQIDGLDTSRVNKIEAITIKQKVVLDERGLPTDFEIDIPDLSIWLDSDPASDQSWIDFFDSFVIKGNSGQDSERSGAISFSDASGTPVATLGLSHLGISGLTPYTDNSGGQAIRRVKAELYCEDITFKYEAGWA